jgi:hypothetical protein
VRTPRFADCHVCCSWRSQFGVLLSGAQKQIPIGSGSPIWSPQKVIEGFSLGPNLRSPDSMNIYIYNRLFFFFSFNLVIYLDGSNFIFLITNRGIQRDQVVGFIIIIII